MADNGIALRRGQTFTRRFTFLDAVGAPLDLTARTIHFRLWMDLGGPAEIALLSFSTGDSRLVKVVPNTAGQVDLILASADTAHAEGPYTYSLWSTVGSTEKIPLVLDTFQVGPAGYP